MSESFNQTSTSKTPTHAAYHVRDRKGGDGERKLTAREFPSLADVPPEAEWFSGKASIALFGNTNQPVETMVRSSDLFVPMPEVCRGFPSRCSPAPGSLESSILLMNQLIPLATVIAILIAPCARGQSSLDADLERFQQTSAKVVADLTAAKTLQISSAKTIYLQALQMADRQATLQGNIEAVKDTIAEETALSENRNLPATPGAALPKNLFNLRASYLQALLKAEQAFLIRQKQFSTDQLRALGALESRARVANDAAILEKLEAEKTKLLSDAPSRLPKVRKTPVQANRRASVSIS